MQSAEIIVLGAGGFVGGWLLEEIRGRVDITAWPDNHADHVDVLDVAALADLFARHRPRAVVNLAAIASPVEASRSPDSAWQVNFQGTMNIARAILTHSPETRLLQVGSSDEYGLSFAEAGGPIAENTPLRPTGTYGATKSAADILVAQLHHEGLGAVRFRPFNHTGPGQAPVYVVSAFARQVARIAAGLQPPVVEVGNLDAVRDFLDVRDVVRAYVDVALTDRAVEGRVFNLASGSGSRIGALLDRLLALAGVSAEIRIDPARNRPNDIPVAIGDPAAIRDAIGWRPRFDLDQTLSDVLGDWRARIAAEVQQRA